ncbi:hypothetical protein FGG78_22725 [Thioclava sp. BHET1]|nr:hypothetical protein FGG78_22725 [Thioclava sp. BHET1]
MRVLLRYALKLILREAAIQKVHATRKIQLTLALVIAVIAAVGLAAALGIVLLTLWLGPIWALALLLGVAILACLVILILMQAEARRHRALMALQAAERARAMETVAILFGPGMGKTTLLGLAGLAVLMFAGRGKGGPGA